MFRTIAVVAAIVAVIAVLKYQPPPDPVRPVDPIPAAQEVARVADFPILVPADPGWQATAVRYESTPQSDGAKVWFTGGVYSVDGPFASISQSTAASDYYLEEQTSAGRPADLSTVDGVNWQRYESPKGDRSLVLLASGETTVVAGTGSWTDLERFAGSVLPVSAPAQS